jgi:hypothetical protein
LGCNLRMRIPCARRRALGKILRLDAATAPISGFVDP